MTEPPAEGAEQIERDTPDPSSGALRAAAMDGSDEVFVRTSEGPRAPSTDPGDLAFVRTLASASPDVLN